MFKVENKITPWQEKGRWYHVFVESDGSAATVSDHDEGFTPTVSTVTLTMPAKFMVIDYVVAAHNDASSSSSFTKLVKFNSSNVMTVNLPAVAAYDYADVWIFGHYYE